MDMTPPPAGSPNFFVGSQDDNACYGAPSDALNIYKFHYDPVTPGNSTFTLTNTLPTQPFNSVLSSTCTSTRACIPQPGTTSKIDHLGFASGRCFGLPIVILALMSRWSPTSLSMPEQDLTVSWQAFAGGSCAILMAARPSSRRARMRLVLPMEFIAGWEASP